MAAGFIQYLWTFQQLVVVNVKNARGHLGAFENAAGLHEVPAFITGERGVADSMETMAAAFDSVAEAGKAFVVVFQFQNFVIEAVDVFPQLA